MNYRIEEAVRSDQLECLGNLFREYHRELDVDLDFQGFEDELRNLPGKYAFPRGIALIGYVGKEPVGCVAVRPLDTDVCEMKRLYVQPDFRQYGLGKVLAYRALEFGQQAGYRTTVLDSLDRLSPALRLYRSLGFREAEPYYDNPLSGVVYLQYDYHWIGNGCSSIG